MSSNSSTGVAASSLSSSLVEAIHLAHLPRTVTVYAALFRDVRNAAALCAQLLAGNSAFEYAFVDARALVSTTHALAAVFRAAVDALADRLRSRNVHSEIVFSLSPNNNIAESFRRFGVADSTTDLLAVKVGGIGVDGEAHTLESVSRHLTDNVEGTLVPFTDAEIRRASDLAAIRKVYKLNSNAKAPKGGAVNGNAACRADDNSHAHAKDMEERKEIEIAALGMMALKGS